MDLDTLTWYSTYDFIKICTLHYWDSIYRGTEQIAFSKLPSYCKTRCKEMGTDSKLKKFALNMKDEKARLQGAWVLFSVGGIWTFAFKPNLIMHSSDLHLLFFLNSRISSLPKYHMFSPSITGISVASTTNRLKTKVLPSYHGWKVKVLNVWETANVSLINFNIFSFDWPFQTESQKHWGWKEPLEIN